MKNLFKIFTGAMTLAAVVSCDLNKTPVFDDKDAFVAIDITSVSVDENAGTVSIPVTIASANPMNTTVTYEVVDSTAKNGVNFSLTDESAVLLYDGEARTMNIVLNIIDKPGVPDGDLIFTVNLLGAGNSLNLGANSSCTVKIADLDHPLADILGTYTVTTTDAGLGETSFQMTMEKDSEDPTVVWVSPICPFLTTYGLPMKVYGNVSEDHKTISIPCGQTFEDYITLVQLEFDGSYIYPESSGNIEMTSTTSGVFTTEQGIGLDVEGSYYGGAVMIQGTTVWTKK